MGSASFRNCTFTEIAKSWPTFSSGDILRKVFSTHFWPALSTWMGPGCRKRSLLLSLAKQSAAASTSVIGSRCRSMQLTIAKTDGSVLQPSQERVMATSQLSNRPRTLSNLPFDVGNAFRLDGGVIAEPGQPMHIRFSPEPGDLALGIVAMRLLRRSERRFPIYFAAQKLHRLFVSQRRERARLSAIFFEKLFGLGDNSF